MIEHVKEVLSQSGSRIRYLRHLAIAMVTCLLGPVLPACDDDLPSEPAGGGPYLVEAYLMHDYRAAVDVTRQSSDYPSALQVVVSVAGDTLAFSRCCSDDDKAVFSIQLEPTPGQSYPFAIAIDDLVAAGTLTAPGEPCSVFFVRPPPDSLTYRVGEPISVAWQYDGVEPTGFGLLASCGSTSGAIVIHQLDYSGGETQDVLSNEFTQACGEGNTASIAVQAYREEPIGGSMAAPGSKASVVLARSSITLIPQTLSATAGMAPNTRLELADFGVTPLAW
jgi:hypothetical protein